MIRQATLVVVTLFTVGAAWLWWSPYRAIDGLANFDASAEELAQLYARDRVRAGFGRQTVAAVDSYPPPLTRDVLLNALSAPESVRMLVAEPFGEWQFAAAEGLPEELRTGDGAGPMPRMLETSDNWIVERDGLVGFTARGGERSGSHVYRFERNGISWYLVEITLSTTIR